MRRLISSVWHQPQAQYNCRAVRRRIALSQFMSFLVAACTLIGAAPTSTRAQAPIRVALGVTEDTGGILESRFRSALRTLDGIDVVSRYERADYVLSIVVLCQPNDCRDTRYYSLAIVFTEPIDRTATWISFRYAHRDAGDSTFAGVPLLSEATEVLRERGFQRRLGLWATEWGSNRYERAIREFASLLDSQCFEKRRIMNRQLLTEFGSAEWRAAEDAILEGDWMC